MCFSKLREYNLDKNAAWDTASEKIERRTPYIKSWGDGKSVAKTSEEATLIWKSVKNEEKKIRLPPLLEKFILEKEDEENDKSEEKTTSGISNEFENNIEENGLDRIDETLDKSGSTGSTDQTDVEDEKSTLYLSGEQKNETVHSEVANIINKDEIGDISTVEEKEGTKNSIIDKKDSFPLITRNFVRITEVLGLQKLNETNAITSASLGFAAGALIVTLLQRIRFR